MNYRLGLGIVALIWLNFNSAVSLYPGSSLLSENGDVESDIAAFLNVKSYIPKDRDLPKTSFVKKNANDVTYLLSKLSDQELIKLLNEQPKKDEYDLNDIVKVALNPQSHQDLTRESQTKSVVNYNKKEKKLSPQPGYFRLDDKIVDPFAQKPGPETNHGALQKIQNLLYSRPNELDDDMDDEKKEALFDVLVTQLKALCCKSKTKKRDSKKLLYKSILDELVPRDVRVKTSSPNFKSSTAKKSKNEHLFLIINEAVNTDVNDDLVLVDPNSLGKNSSVLLLGPITTPLTDVELKTVMNRISNELSKPEYQPLLRQLSNGTIESNNLPILKSLITGPETRRYIKPHRCNHQAPLSKVHGGTQWIICTGYLNLNTPSFYD